MEPRANYTWRDGHVYSLSWYTDPMAMYYNKQLVVDAGLDPENPPVTYSEYLEWAAALTKDTNGDGQPDQWFIIAAHRRGVVELRVRPLPLLHRGDGQQ